MSDAYGDSENDGNDGDGLILIVVCVFFADWVIQGGQVMMGKVMKEAVEQWKEQGKFSEPLSGKAIIFHHTAASQNLPLRFSRMERRVVYGLCFFSKFSITV